MPLSKPSSRLSIAERAAAPIRVPRIGAPRGGQGPSRVRQAVRRGRAERRIKASEQNTDLFQVGWTRARSFAAGLDSAPARRLASRVYPHRSAVLAAGLTAFLLGALPLLLVAHAGMPLAPWHALAFGCAVPAVLWAFCLATLATHFHPQHGLIASVDAAQAAWHRQLVRGCAAITVWGFAAAPVVVLVASLV